MNSDLRIRPMQKKIFTESRSRSIVVHQVRPGIVRLGRDLGCDFGRDGRMNTTMSARFIPARNLSVVLILAIVYLAGIYPAIAQDVELEWAAIMGGEGFDFVSDVAVDVSGNVYTTGFFAGGGGLFPAGGPADFDPGPGTAILDVINPADIFVSKLTADGHFGWAVAMGGTVPNQSANDIAVDGSGDVYISGSFSGTVDFDPGPGTANLESAGRDDIFICKLDSAGNFLWAKRMGSFAMDVGEGLWVDAAGNVYTTGMFVHTVDFDPGVGTANLISNPETWDVFVQKLDSAGNFVWAVAMGGADDDLSSDITVDNSGNVYTTGRFSGTADFDPGPGIANLTSEDTGVFVSKLDSHGNFVWVEGERGRRGELSSGIAVDPTGNVYTTGRFGGFVPQPEILADWDIFIEKLDSAGNMVWARTMGGTHHDGSSAITVDNSGNVYTTGIFSHTVDFDPGPGIFNLQASEGGMFLQKLDTGGNLVWVIAMDGGSSGVAIDNSGNMHTAGKFDGDIIVSKLVDGTFVPVPDPFSGSSGGGGGGCFIATAAYGTPLAEEVGVLRGVRDAYMLNNAFGTAFVDTYYRVSPPLADVVGESVVLRGIVRVVLTPIVVLSRLLMVAPFWTSLVEVVLLVVVLRAMGRRLGFGRLV